jgi:predicted dithiol-disulfide oxidoreductase (DUF899 family)
MGCTLPWYSSFGSDFNYDFHVTLDEAVAPFEYNYRDKAELMQKGESYFTQGESHGLSVFLRDGGSIFHTYSTYARGTDLLAGTYNYLDLTALGRQEDWEEPAGVAQPVYGMAQASRQIRRCRGSESARPDNTSTAQLRNRQLS